MSRFRSSIPYEILHGIFPSQNLSAILAYLSYFPPPPPVIPGPPPRRSWTCSADVFSSCYISDDLNPSILRQYIPRSKSNQSYFSTNNTSHHSTPTQTNWKSFSLFDFFQNQLTFILLLIIFLTIFIFVILLLLLFLYLQRLRQRQLTSHSHTQTNNNTNNNNNNNNNTFELNNNNNLKNEKFYSRLIPYREKHRKRSANLRTPSDGNKNLLRLSNHDSPVLEVRRLSKTTRLHSTTNDEQEEAL